ncbi:MAG: phosphatidate cytidylyltransferase [Betaproteobacteria bacterium]|nr:phosphatidate cytidylyltransferase [Betaproteobacteria bacterium]
MLRARVLTALVLVALLLVALFALPIAGWLVAVAFVTALASYEWGRLCSFSSMAAVAYALVTATALVTGIFLLPESLGDLAQGAGSSLEPVYVAAVVFWVGVVPFLLWRQRVVHQGLGAMAIGWMVLLPAGAAMVHLRAMSPWVLLASMAAIWMADIAAYFGGQAFGRRRLAPAISPGKTWEGAASAAVAVATFGAALASYTGVWTMMSLGLVVFAGVALTAVSIVGDLFESLVKRLAGVKDSGRLLPGHGGILDRIDSLTSTLPFLALAILMIGY